MAFKFKPSTGPEALFSAVIDSMNKLDLKTLSGLF